MKKTQKQIISAYMARIGARGTGAAKRRGDAAYYSALAARRACARARTAAALKGEPECGETVVSYTPNINAQT
jgi:hypothetical protein